MYDGSLIQDQDPFTIASSRRNPILADLFGRMHWMERRGSGLRKIMEAYRKEEYYTEDLQPEFISTHANFRVILKNLNYAEDAREAEAGEEEQMEHVLYTAVLQAGEGSFVILFPNDELTPVAESSLEEAVNSAREEIALAVMDAEEEGRTFIPAHPKKEDLADGEQLIVLDVWMPYERSKVKETYTKKTLTIPTWLDLLAKSKNVNFSKALTEGVKKELGIS